MSYVANLRIERVDHVGERRTGVNESLNLTVRSETLVTLKEKVAAHLALIDREDIGND